MHNQGTLKRLISDLEMEHRDLDNVIEQITKELPFDQLQVQRLKKKAFIKRSVNSFKEPNHSRHNSIKFYFIFQNGSSKNGCVKGKQCAFIYGKFGYLKFTFYSKLDYNPRHEKFSRYFRN